MTFNSLTFLIFLFVSVFAYWLIPHKVRYIFLLIASYIFYMWWNYKLVVLILSTTLLTYFAGILIEKTSNKKLKKTYLIITLVFTLGLLIFFKYFNFLYNSVINVLNIFNTNIENRVFDIILPVGISFYTFQTLSYVIDVYKNRFKAEKNIGYYALYVSFFPQLVAGPIERPNDLIPELKKEKKISMDNFLIGIKFILIGFVRKCVIADICGIYVDNVFSNLSNANSFAILLGAFLFLVQIYNDFAGYSEIALGSAKLLGIDLSINFNFPLLSKSYTEFFRRWHITLNRWFTEYVYIPLGGNRKGKARKILNTMIVFMLCGLWHGAAWTFVLWGLAAGIMITIETLLKKPTEKLANKLHINLESKAITIIRISFMLILFSLSSILFRAQSINEIGIAFNGIFTHFGSSFDSISKSLRITVDGYIYLVISISLMALLKFLYNRSFISDVKEMKYSYLVLAIFTVFLIAFSWIYLISLTDASGFQYFQF